MGSLIGLLLTGVHHGVATDGNQVHWLFGYRPQLRPSHRALFEPTRGYRRLPHIPDPSAGRRQSRQRQAQASPVARLGTALLRWPALTGFVRGPWLNRPSRRPGLRTSPILSASSGYSGVITVFANSASSMTIPGPLARPVARPGRVHHPDLSLRGGLPRRRGRSSRPSQK